MSAQIIKLEAVRSFRATKQEAVAIPIDTQHIMQAGIELQRADFVRQVGEMLTKRLIDTQAPLPTDVRAVLNLAYFALRGGSPGGIE